MAEKKGMKAIVAFVERGQGKNVARVFSGNQIQAILQCTGRGTASSELLDVLGLGTTERDILIGIAARDNTERMMYKLDDELRGQLDAHGIIFDLPLTGLNSRIATVLLHQENGGNGGSVLEQQAENSLILVVVNQGHTDTVMDTARGAGARGGTIIRARWAGAKDTEQFYGISIQDEKELIAIVSPKENRNAIMETVNRKHGLGTEAGAMICSLGIDHILRG